jgi:hypothetical protein
MITHESIFEKTYSSGNLPSLWWEGMKGRGLKLGSCSSFHFSVSVSDILKLVNSPSLLYHNFIRRAFSVLV